MQKITTFLMYDDSAEEAAKLYTSLFKNSRITSISRAGDDESSPATSVTFVLDGQEFYAYNGGPHFSFSEGMSLMVRCESQEEVDYLWDRLTEGGAESQCGWLRDRFGVSWQIIPSVYFELVDSDDPAAVKRTIDAMLQMVKMDIAALEKAHAGG